jgi:hypothetical protein
MIKFFYILQMFNEGIVSGPADISVFNFSPHVVQQVTINCSHRISYPPSKLRQNGNQWWHVNSILDVPPIEKIKGSKVRRTRWPSDGPAPANPFLWKLAI